MKRTALVWSLAMVLVLAGISDVQAAVKLPSRDSEVVFPLIQMLKPKEAVTLLGEILGTPNWTYVLSASSNTHMSVYRLTNGDTLLAAFKDDQLDRVYSVKAGKEIYPPPPEKKKLDQVPLLGEKLPKDMIGNAPEHALINSGTLAPSLRVEVEGVDYQVAYEPGTGEVVFIATSSLRFATPEGFNMRNSAQDILDKHPRCKQTYPYWGDYLILPSGWEAALEDVDVEKGTPDGERRITFFFRRAGDAARAWKGTNKAPEAKTSSAK